MPKRPHTPIALVILDGWGHSDSAEANAIELANTPNWDRWMAEYPHTLIDASGQSVGLPNGQMGNSEVGHLNIGAGRIVRMDISRIDHAIESGDFFENPVLVAAVEHAKRHGTTLHLMGLVSHGGVHSWHEHLYALLRLARQRELTRVVVHCFLDGRDTPPQSADGFVLELERVMKEIGVGRVASVVGRYFAMDRDKRWDRVEKAWRLLVRGEGTHATDAVTAIRNSYAADVGDEFVEPICIVDGTGAPVGVIADDDAVIFFNFRADRAREITRALTDHAFSEFDRGDDVPGLHFVCLSQYDATFNLPVAYPPHTHEGILADVMAEHGLRNVRIAETEKYAHVTFFFNGGVEREYPGERRVLVQSPKVATYDLQPEMSAPEVTRRVLETVGSGDVDVLIVNFANADMVGHTGMIEPAIKAVETVDACLGQIANAILACDGAMLVTADHGNAERMVDPVTGAPHTAHTTNLVPFVVVTNDWRGQLQPGGSLEDIAPTLLGLLGLPPSPQMTGSDLRR
ncbi:MAG: 2,3-bisphosphoglycerate-independent phosphoglycerate mutase [Blastocatellia bacterium]|nr:2,3-bisphosphoglycerate-independent phosphoglycerate mutase [Blastocatellia bacterium]MBK6428299.1 2,3-bisphosphoglycerate-independent phosphoglycerate mutase [Blastocatellia bacterium]